MDISELYNLPTAEKPRIITALWDNIAGSNEPLQLSPAVSAEIECRRLELIADPSIGINRDELWARVQKAAQDRAESDG